MTFNRKRAKVTPRRNNMLHMWKNILKKSLLKIKIRDNCHLTCKYRDEAQWVKL